MIYLDSSALVKRYMREVGTEALRSCQKSPTRLAEGLLKGLIIMKIENCGDAGDGQ